MEIENNIHEYISHEERMYIKNHLKTIEHKYKNKKNLVSVFHPCGGSIFAVYGFLKNKAVARFFDSEEEAIKAWFELQDYQEKMQKE